MVAKPQQTIAFGPEYPNALTDLLDGVLMPLVREQAWSRIFRHPTTGMIFRIPRTMDGSATATLETLRGRWPDWTSSERRDFAQGVYWLREQDDFADILRFLVREGDPTVWSSIGLSIARGLPQDEAYHLLVDLMERTDLGGSANLVQAIALTRHPLAASTIRSRLDRLRAAPGLWEDDPRVNQLAINAMWATKHLAELGEDPNTLVEFVRALAEHRCTEVGRFVRMHLKATYRWLSESGEGAPV